MRRWLRCAALDGLACTAFADGSNIESSRSAGSASNTWQAARCMGSAHVRSVVQTRALALEVACERLQRRQAVDLLAQGRRCIDHDCQLSTPALKSRLDLPTFTSSQSNRPGLQTDQPARRCCVVTCRVVFSSICLTWSEVDKSTWQVDTVGTAAHLRPCRILALLVLPHLRSYGSHGLQLLVCGLLMARGMLSEMLHNQNAGPSTCLCYCHCAAHLFW